MNGIINCLRPCFSTSRLADILRFSTAAVEPAKVSKKCVKVGSSSGNDNATKQDYYCFKKEKILVLHVQH